MASYLAGNQAAGVIIINNNEALAENVNINISFRRLAKTVAACGAQK